MRIRLLGRLQVTDGTGRTRTVDDLPRRARQVLGVLALRHDRVLSKDALADAVWGEQLPGNHASALEHYVSLIRRQLQPGVRAAESFIVTHSGGYLFDTGRALLDLAQLRGLVESADSAEAGSESRLRGRRQILELTAASPFEDEEAIWAEGLRREVREARVTALTEVAVAVAPEDPEQGLRIARAAIELDRYHEQPYRVAIRAAGDLGRPDEAARLYQLCRVTLTEELGIDPSAQTVEVFRAAVNGVKVTSPATVESARSASSTERAPGLPAQTGLVDGVAGFVGREAELALILGPDPLATLHIVGPPGAGKTSLLRVSRLDAPGRVGLGTPAGSVQSLRLTWLRTALADLGAEPETLALVDTAMAEGRSLHVSELECIATLLERPGPVVLAVDDAGELDAESVAELRWLRQRCGQLRIVLAYRYPRAMAARPAAALQAQLVLRLPPLTGEVLDADVLLLSGGIPPLVAVAHRPDPVRRAVAMHVARQRTEWMSPGGWELLQLCAGLGPLRVDQLAGLIERPVAEVLGQVDHLIHAHLLAEGAVGKLRHSSELVRDAVAEQMSAAHSNHLRHLLAGA